MRNFQKRKTGFGASRRPVAFNRGASDSAAVLLIAAEPNLMATTGVDRASGFEQLEVAPELSENRGAKP